MNVPALPHRYSGIALLGEGGQGRVYRVRDSLRDRDLALKLVSASDAEFLRREFDTLRQIRHENLIQVFDWGTLETGDAFYTMELVDGDDWGRRMGAPQPPDEVRRILTGLLRGLAHLHCHGEIHGDLKPGNILLGQGDVVKVTDVGMTGRQEGGVAGTPGYTAPECWKGAPSDVRADLYSVGVMAYEALTGKHPFGGRTIREVVAGQIEGWVPSPGAHRVKVPADLERVVMRALEREPALRQGSADEFMEGFGVEDRVGVILGGRFVDPAGIVSQLVVLAKRPRPNAPMLIWIHGAPGVGKSELLEQVSHALVAGGVRCIRVFLSEVTDFARTLDAQLPGPPAAIKSADALDALTRKVATAAREQQVAIVVDSDGQRSHAAIGEARSLAQRLFAESIERGAINAVILIAASKGEDDDLFSASLKVPELDELGSASLIAGLLGASDLQPGNLTALHQAAGGNPSLLQGLLFDLVSRGTLTRIAGQWKLIETGTIAEGVSSTFEGSWNRRWGGLPPGHQDLLGLVALLEEVNEANATLLETLARSHGGVADLSSGGWLRFSARVVRLPSEAHRAMILRFLGNERARGLAARVLDQGANTLAEVPVRLELIARPTAEVVRAALAHASTAMEAQDQARAKALLLQCAPHEALLESEAERAALHLMIAECLLWSSELVDAEAHARKESIFNTSDKDQGVRARAHWILGTVLGRSGRIVEAKAELESAMQDAQASRDDVSLLRAITGYAELAWMHGNDVERAAVIDLARRSLRKMGASPSIGEDRGRLVYTLGASLIRAGQFDEATKLLETEIPQIGRPYWRARAANALATALFYLGRYDDALQSMDSGLEQLGDGEAPEVRARIHANRGACLNAMGRIREALHDNELALLLSRRAGSGYDIVAAAAGIAVDLYYLGRYEETIAQAKEVFALATRIKNVVYQFKGLELEGFAGLAVGSSEVVDRALDEVGLLPADHDPVRTLPRIERIRARRAMMRGDRQEAREALGRAMEILKDGNDLEDLWGVEIELAVLNQDELGNRPLLDLLAAVTTKARAARNIVVEVDAAAAIADILANGEKGDLQLLRSLTLALGRAESGGFVAQAARISVGLGAALIDAGDTKAGRSRLIQAQRLLTQIASDLNPSLRQSFVQSPHVALALAEIARRLAPSRS